MSAQQQTRAEAVFAFDAVALAVLFLLVFLGMQPPYPVSTIFFVALLVPAFGGLLFSGGVPRGLWFLLVMVAFIALFAVGGAL